MDRIQLKEKIRPWVKKTLEEVAYAGPGAVEKMKNDPNFSRVKDKKGLIDRMKKGEAVELSEMARKPVVYKVSPNFVELASNVRSGGPINPGRLMKVIDFIEGKETISLPELAAGMGYGKQMPKVYPIFAALIDQGALISGKEEKIQDDDIEPSSKENIPQNGDQDQEPNIPKTYESDYVSKNKQTLNQLVKAYKNSGSRIPWGYFPDLYENIFKETKTPNYNDYLKTLDKAQEGYYNKYERLEREVTNDLRAMPKDIQEATLKDLEKFFEAAGARPIYVNICRKLKRPIIPKEIDYDNDENYDYFETED